MAKGQRGIFISEAQYKILEHSKRVLEKVSGLDLSWGAYLAIISSGSLALYALKGLELFCPDCGGRKRLLRYVAETQSLDTSRVTELETTFAEPSPSSSREQPAKRRQ
jgi:hypothetical protein